MDVRLPCFDLVSRHTVSQLGRPSPFGAANGWSGVDTRGSISWPRVGIDWARNLLSRSYAVPILQLFALTVMVFPSDAVIKAIGAQGYVASLVGIPAFAAFLAAILLGLHDPLRHRTPIRCRPLPALDVGPRLVHCDGPRLN